MPVPLPATPWIQGPDRATNFARGAELGLAAARINAARQEAQQRLAFAHQQADQEAQLKQEMLHKQMLMEQQKLAIQEQYHNQQISLGRDKVKAYQAKMAADATNAATKFAAMQRIPVEAAALEAQGVDKKTAYIRAALNSGMIPPASAGTLIGQIPATAGLPVTRVDPLTKAQLIQQPDGSWTQLREATLPDLDKTANARMTALYSKLNELETKLIPSSNDAPELQKEYKKQAEETRMQINDLLYSQKTPGGTPIPAYPAFPDITIRGDETSGPATLSPSVKPTGNIRRVIKIQRAGEVSPTGPTAAPSSSGRTFADVFSGGAEEPDSVPFIRSSPPVPTAAPAQESRHGMIMSWLLGEGEKPDPAMAAQGALMKGVGSAAKSVGKALLNQAPAKGSEWSRKLEEESAKRHEANMKIKQLSIADLLSLLSPSNVGRPESEWTRALAEAELARRRAGIDEESDTEEDVE